jgi:hypothetical protein
MSAEVLSDRDRLPEPLYTGGYEHAADAVVIAAERFAEHPITTLYYPGSSFDASLANIPGMQTVHADSRMTIDGIEAFAILGSIAAHANAETWKPPEAPDMIALINSTGIDPKRAIEISGLQDGGLILWASLDQPSTLKEWRRTRLLGVITFSGNGTSVVDTENLQEYFEKKPFDDLELPELEYFLRTASAVLAEVEQSLDLHGDELRRTVYDSLDDPANESFLRQCMYAFPTIKQGTFFIFRYKNPARS